MHKSTHSRARTCALVACCWASSAALAQQAPQVQRPPAQGTTSYATYYVIQTPQRMEMPDGGFTQIQVMTGINRNTDGQPWFDNMSVRCIGVQSRVGGKLTMSGSCTETDGDGDKIFITYIEGVHTLVGGTGKYQGITGSAPFAPRLVRAPAGDAATVVVDHKLSWKLP